MGLNLCRAGFSSPTWISITHRHNRSRAGAQGSQQQCAVPARQRPRQPRATHPNLRPVPRAALGFGTRIYKGTKQMFLNYSKWYSQRTFLSLSPQENDILFYFSIAFQGLHLHNAEIFSKNQQIISRPISFETLPPHLVHDFWVLEKKNTTKKEKYR